MRSSRSACGGPGFRPISSRRRAGVVRHAAHAAAGWVVIVSLIIPWVDAYSVWKGPTKVIVTHHTHVFTALSYAFPIPGEHHAAQLGVPDVLFFALFLAAAARFVLRLGWTWLAL